MTKKRGFTLTELLTVIGIIAILFLIGIPVFRAYRPSLQLSGSVRELITDLRYVQQLAVTEQVDYGIRFFVAEDKYQIVKYITEEEPLEEKKLPSQVSFHQIEDLTDDRVLFNPYGAVKDEAGTITLINIRNDTTTIDIRPSGFVKIIQ